MKVSPRHSGFTLIEMLVVIAIIGILAGITVPTLKNMRHADSMLASTRQVLDDVARARQFAISQRATVYMVFCPSNFWLNTPYLNQAAFNALNNPLPAFQAEKAKVEKLYGKQLSSYTFVTLRSVGEQPGKQSPRYLTRWLTLPEGAIIPNWKFQPRNVATSIVNANNQSGPPFVIWGFAITNTIPFPSEDTPSTTPFWLPYIAFNHLGQLTKDGVNLSDEDEYIPVARGGVIYARDQNRIATQQAPTVIENPEGNSTNAYTIIHIDKLTGRARLEKQEFAP